ncbi:MFS transporter [Tamilnaduibacter salinus]|nr:MFS transporter [Tamilnaduibacter salinus]
MSESARSGTTSRTLWGIIAVGFGVMFLSSSIKGAYQVYFRDLSELFDLGRAQFALSGALFGLCLGLVSPLVGTICDRYGPSRSMISGALVAALAFLLLGLFQNFPLFLVAYGVMAAYALAAMTFVPMGVWIDNLFGERHKGLAYAAVSNGVAIGFMVLSPLWVWLNGWLDWSTLALMIAMGFVVGVAVPLYWADRYFPVGIETHSESQSRQAPGVSGVLRELRQPLFILLAISFAGCGSSMAFIDLHYAPLVQEAGLPDSQDAASALALSLSVLGGFELLGALAVGHLAGKVQPAMLLALLYGVRSMILAWLAISPGSGTFVVFGAFFGATYMGTVVLTSMMCLRLYGASVKGRMFGLLFTVHQLAVFGTAWLGGLARDLTGDYTLTTLGVAAFCGLSVIAALALQVVTPRSNSRSRVPSSAGSGETAMPSGQGQSQV